MKKIIEEHRDYGWAKTTIHGYDDGMFYLEVWRGNDLIKVESYKSLIGARIARGLICKT